MENLQELVNKVKISDSTHSSSYGGSQSRKSNNLEKIFKKKKESTMQFRLPKVKGDPQRTVAACSALGPVPFNDAVEENKDVIKAPMELYPLPENAVGNMEISNSKHGSYTDKEGCFCMISIHDGLVKYSTSSLTDTLGYPKDMLIGRSFMEFLHPMVSSILELDDPYLDSMDSATFTSQITNVLAAKTEKVIIPHDAESTMVCRIIRYGNLSSGSAVGEQAVTFMPFLLKFTFKLITDEEREVILLELQATPLMSAFKTPKEAAANPVPFEVRHAANGNIEYVGPESVPYLGYLPQDLHNTNALLLYHPDDLPYLAHIYKTIVREGNVQRSEPYRMVAQNGDFVKVVTEWSSFINPWFKKLEFVVGTHHILEGPDNPDVFQAPEPQKPTNKAEEDIAQALRKAIITIMNSVSIKPAKVSEQQMTQGSQYNEQFMESLIEDHKAFFRHRVGTRTDDELFFKVRDQHKSD